MFDDYVLVFRYGNEVGQLPEAEPYKSENLEWYRVVLLLLQIYGGVF